MPLPPLEFWSQVHKSSHGGIRMHKWFFPRVYYLLKMPTRWRLYTVWPRYKSKYRRSSLLVPLALWEREKGGSFRLFPFTLVPSWNRPQSHTFLSQMGRNKEKKTQPEMCGPLGLSKNELYFIMLPAVWQPRRGEIYESATKLKWLRNMTQQLLHYPRWTGNKPRGKKKKYDLSHSLCRLKEIHPPHRRTLKREKRWLKV